VTQDLPKFNPNERCAKCGAYPEYVRLCPPEITVKVSGERVLSAEYLRVMCERCGYTWFRAPLDAK
jgi:predicted nucleic-acid-binding Zn-ribbon protein